MPRRFGSYEPFQHKLADVGPDGFVEAWNQESSMLFWKGSSRPCFGGSSSGLGLERSWPKSQGEAVGSIGLTLDGRAFEDPAWRRQLVDTFEAVAVATGSFAAVADATRGVRLSRGGSLSYRADTVSPWRLVARGEWLGLPEEQPWLLWLDARYRDFIGLDGAEGAVLMTRAEKPSDRRPEGRGFPFGRNRRDGGVYPVPDAARLRSTGQPGQGGERIRAAEVPDWL
jgi:hypothetical protein